MQSLEKDPFPDSSLHRLLVARVLLFNQTSFTPLGRKVLSDWFDRDICHQREIVPHRLILF